jgi:hypothetical protein
MSNLYVQECCVCFIRFAVPKSFDDARRRDGKSFFCPVGHSQSYTESENDRIRRERDRLKQEQARLNDEVNRQRELCEAAERSASARKGQITRLKKRAAAGVCPCCNRSFENLKNHMSAKHPGFVAEEVA